MKKSCSLVLCFLCIVFSVEAQELEQIELQDAIDYEAIAFGDRRTERYEFLRQNRLVPAELERFMLTKPIIENNEDAIAHLYQKDNQLGALKLGIANGAISIDSVFTKVPGVPDIDRYNHPRFREIDSRISIGCKNSQSNYSMTSSSAFLNASFSGISNDLVNMSLTYEKECLGSLADAPDTVLNVTGYFYENDNAFCSGTIVGPNKIATSRHCFVDDDGSKRLELRYLEKGLISFRTVSSHNGRKSFKVKVSDGEDINSFLKPVNASNDFLVLQTTRTMQNIAKLGALEVGLDSYPIDSYLLGLNRNVDDLLSITDPMKLLKVATPEKACAILQRTENGCLYHTCQTSPSTSGAGLLVKDSESGEITLVGVHRGGISTGQGCEPMVPLDGKINIAYALNNS